MGENVAFSKMTLLGNVLSKSLKEGTGKYDQVMNKSWKKGEHPPTQCQK